MLTCAICGESNLIISATSMCAMSVVEPALMYTLPLISATSWSRMTGRLGTTVPKVKQAEISDEMQHGIVERIPKGDVPPNSYPVIP